MLPYDTRESIGNRPSALLLAGKHQYLYAQKIVTGSVLDVGAGFCTLKEYLKDCDYTAIDGTEWIAKIGGATYCDIMDYESEPFDYVCAFGVIESFDDLKPLADKLKSLAKYSVLFSFTPKCIREGLHDHTKEQVIESFGNCSFEPKPINGEFFGRCDLCGQ